jgi:hypothetical protein
MRLIRAIAGVVIAGLDGELGVDVDDGVGDGEALASPATCGRGDD